MECYIKTKSGGYYVGAKHETIVSVLTGCTSQKDLFTQLKKLDSIMSLDDFYQPEIISDLSLFTSKSYLYKEIIKRFDNAVVSTLPIYQVKSVNESIDKNSLLDIIIEQCEEGVGFITIHPTPTLKLLELSTKRYVPITSRGGVMVVKDLIKSKKKENVYIEILDEIINICYKYNVAISIGASFRSSNIFDSLDVCQIEEFKIQKQIADYVYSKGVNIIIEGPGHSNLSRLKKISEYYKNMNYPIMPLGPIPTDISIGQDHISSAIGASVLGMLGCVDIITSVTREEHTGKIPSIDSSIEAIMASKIAAHIINIDKVNKVEEDIKIVTNRMMNKTCIYNKNSSGCSRCAHVCPLKFSIS
ncbi:phosphomethylpyrimidine synthase ThiC [Sphingobacterium bovisgrunnientis]|uniref:phosphomethylpyrimidine synthase ThiC n=1 Tax=Sphingobacterium bovisgrunnientis TaxID=1874697 RepID=UPI00195AACF7|nr:phosphomethylpyrimidine synthase ThiC [Sphingobacterium bovisgrunnientis]